MLPGGQFGIVLRKLINWQVSQLVISGGLTISHHVVHLRLTTSEFDYTAEFLKDAAP